jgi:glyoxylase-like metal-dependent hydrolase (beta-lactamase superfamily II)
MLIKRRNFLQLMGLAALPVPAWAEQLFLRPQGEFVPLRNNVGIFTERGGTIAWLINQDGVAVVDTQFPENAQNCINRIKEESSNPFKLLFNTHHHGDHSGGNIAFKGMVEKVIAHENSKANQERVAKARNSEDTQLYPDTVFSDTLSQKLGDETITLRYFGPAHTDGDAIIHFENANIVHMGDLIFNRRFPYIDKSAGASVENWIKVLSKARKTFDKDTIYVFGHSGDGYKITGTHEDLKAKEQFLKNLLKFVKKSKKAGKTLEQLVEETTMIPGSPEWKGDGIQRPLGAAWEEVSE